MTSPTYDICVGHAFKVDANGVLQARIDGDPAEQQWPYAGNPSSDNPLRVDPAGGLWVPPQTQVGGFDQNSTGSPSAKITESKSYTTPALQFSVKNPSSSLPANLLLMGEGRWIATINIQSAANGGIQMTEDAPLNASSYTQAQDSGPYDDQSHSWSGQAFALHNVTLSPGQSITVRLASQVWIRNGTATVTYYRNQVVGQLVTGQSVSIVS
jgi:hypothetical protein